MSRIKALFPVEIVPAAAVLAAAAAHLWLVPAEPYWLDSPELTASAFGLTLSHPPGHPLYETMGKLLTLVPAGSIAFRVNLFSTLCAAASLLMALGACVTVMTRGFGTGRTTAVMASTLAVMPLALAPAWAHQAVHSEVYALQAMLLAGVLWLSSRYLVRPHGKPQEEEDARDRDDGFRWLLASFFLFSLSLANHPFISLLLLPPLAAATAAAAVLKRWHAASRRLLFIPAFLAAGLLVYLYLPVRGAEAPTMIMGTIETPGDFLWTISAKVYQKSAAAHELGLMARKSGESIFMILREGGLVMPFIALGGLYFLLRKKHLLPFGLLLLLGVLVTTLSRAFMPFDSSNPDVFGYMLIVMIIQAVSAAAFFGAASRIKWGGLLGFIILLAVPVSVAAANHSRLSLMKRERDCPAKAAFLLKKNSTEHRRPFAHVFSSFYSTAFTDCYEENVLCARPDLTRTGIPFLGYRGVASRAAKHSAELRGVIRGFLVAGELRTSDLALLALDHPVYLEPYPDIPEDFIPYMIPDGTGFLFGAQPASIKDFKAAAGESNDLLRGMIDAAGPCMKESQTGRYFLWLLYNRSLLVARRGDADGALESAKMALELFPEVPQLERLAETLKKKKDPLTDITPFLPPKTR